MIEKIEMPEMDETYKSAMFTKVLGNKINELVGAVNGLQESMDLVQSILVAEPEKRETSVDPYAEQRKWMGKLCRFWDDDNAIKRFWILDNMDKDSIYPYHASGNCWYKHCEPVKPDDDIIYKGE